jgi:hypothetical protein
LFLPEIRHTKRKANEFVGDVQDGPCLKLMGQMISMWEKWAKENPEKSKDWNQVYITFDSMAIAAGTTLITKKGQLNQISGVIFPESMDVARSLFDQFVFKVAEERGLDQLKQCQMEAMNII